MNDKPSHTVPPPALPTSQGQQETPKKRSNLIWLLSLLLPLFVVSAGFLYWQYEVAKFSLLGFQPPEMAAAQYTPKDVIGDLGGLKVKIPRHYAEYVSYSGDPAWGRAREGSVPERTFDSKLRGFAIRARFPDMKGLENAQLRQEHRDNFLNPHNPWLYISITAGDHYPSMGANARNGQAKHLWESSPHWWDNYERLPEDIYGLEAYVLSGVHPETGQPARGQRNTYDVYIQREPSGHVNTYIKCGKPSTPRGVGTCYLLFGLEPEAEVSLNVGFQPSLLPQWREIQQKVRELLLSFEVQEGSK